VTSAVSTTTVTFEFFEDHHKSIGDFIGIGEVVAGGTKNNPYNGYFKITNVTAKTVTVNLQTTFAGSVSVLGRSTWSFNALAGIGLNNVYEGNRVIGATRGFYQDTWSSRGYILRNNYFYDVYFGVNIYMGGIDAAYATAGYIRYGSISKTAGASSNVRFSLGPASPGNHYQSVGDVVEIGNNAGGISDFFGKFVVTEVFNATTFGWTMDPLPASSPGAGNLYQMYSIFTTALFVAEDNIIDLQLHNTSDPGNFPYGMSNGPDVGYTGPSVFKSVFLRGNIIRTTDNREVAGLYSIGISQNYTDSFVAENNIITILDSGAPTVGPIVATFVDNYKTFNNQNAAGRVQRAYYTTDSRYVDGLETDVDDAVLMFLLKK
jgi:hypothetical protein